jgi:hypothetical protein
MQPWLELLKDPVVHADIAPASALAAAHQHRSAPRRDRAPSNPVPPGCAAPRAKARRSGHARDRRRHRGRRSASRRWSPRCEADRPGSGGLCCAVGDRRENPGPRPVSGGDRGSPTAVRQTRCPPESSEQTTTSALPRPPIRRRPNSPLSRRAGVPPARCQRLGLSEPGSRRAPPRREGEQQPRELTLSSDAD